MVPLVITALLYWVLGGRNRAMTPIAGGLLLLWYYGREMKAWKKVTLTPKYVALAVRHSGLRSVVIIFRTFVSWRIWSWAWRILRSSIYFGVLTTR